MKNEHKNILIIGGGQASAYASQEIRKHDSESTVTIVTEEKFLPYERPPLSKNCLVDKRKYEDCLFFPEKLTLGTLISYLNEKLVLKLVVKKIS